MLPPLLRGECEEILAPHLSTLELCFDRAHRRWTAWRLKSGGAPTDISRRTQASCIHDFLVAEIIKNFKGQPGVSIRKRRGLLLVVFRDKITIRFNKYRSSTLRTSTNATTQSDLFAQHALEFEDGVQPLTHLVAGYLLDKLGQQFSRLALTCQMDGTHLWDPIDITDTAIATVQPIHAAKPAAERARVRKARIKSTRKAVKDDNSES
jgi:hypothetical protein